MATASGSPAAPEQDREHGAGVNSAGLVDRRVDVAVCIAALALGLGLVFASGGLRQGSIPDPIGPAGWPRLLGAVLAASSAILILRRIMSWRVSGHLVQSDGGKDDAPGYPSSRARPFLVLGVSFAWLFSVPHVGFLISTFALLVAVLLALRVTAPLKLVLVPLFYSVTVWLLFGQILGVRFPSGQVEDFLRDIFPGLV